MSRLKFAAGDSVIFRGNEDAPFQVVRVEPAMEHPYFLSNNEWAGEHELTIHVPSEPTWEEVEASIKSIVGTLRDRFNEGDKNFLRFEVKAEGRTHGDIKIEYVIGSEQYTCSHDVSGYSLRPVLQEFFRRMGWAERNAPTLLTYTGDEKAE